MRSRAGVPDGGAILVRPDGFTGFRAAPADETTMGALDAHLTTYLVPDVGAIYSRTATAIGRRAAVNGSRSADID